MIGSKDIKFILAIFLLHLIALFVFLIFGHPFFPDSVDYIEQSFNFKNFNSFFAKNWFDEPINRDYFTKRPPLYSILLSISGFNYENSVHIIILQNLISLAGIWIAAQISKKLYPNLNPYPYLIVLFILIPGFWIFPNTIMTETLLAFLLVLAWYSFIIYKSSSKNIYLLINQIALLSAVFTKPVMLFFWIINLFFIIYLIVKNKKIHQILFLSIIPISIFLWNLRNERLTGYRHFSSISTVNLIDYNTKYFLFNSKGSEFADKWIDSIKHKSNLIIDYKEKNEFIKNECSKIIKENLIPYSLFHSKGFIGFFIDPGRFDLVEFFQLNTGEMGFLHYLSKKDFNGLFQLLINQNPLILIFLPIGILINLLLLILFIKSLSRKENFNINLLYGLSIITYIIVLTGPLGGSRFRFPVELILIIIALGAISSIKPLFKGRSFFTANKNLFF